MMGQLANTPSWGVLVKAPLEQVHEILSSSFGKSLIFRTNDGWTAAFYMASLASLDTNEDEAAERLRSVGFVPVYNFDFSKYQFSTSCWNGERWALLGEPLGEDDFQFVEECLGTFRPGEARTWDGTPFLDNVEGETQPEAIVEKLGIPRSFLASEYGN